MKHKQIEDHKLFNAVVKDLQQQGIWDNMNWYQKKWFLFKQKVNKK